MSDDMVPGSNILMGFSGQISIAFIAFIGGCRRTNINGERLTYGIGWKNDLGLEAFSVLAD